MIMIDLLAVHLPAEDPVKFSYNPAFNYSFPLKGTISRAFTYRSLDYELASPIPYQFDNICLG